MAVSAGGSINEDYLRQLVDFILKACLPPEDYDPDTERYIIREVILKVLKDSIPRISQPWFIHKLALDLLGPSEPTFSVEKVRGFGPLVFQMFTLTPLAIKPPPDPSKPYISFHATVIFILSATQAISGFALMLIYGYKSAIQTIKHVNESSSHVPGEPDHLSSSDALTSPLPTTSVISKRQSDSSSLFSVFSQQRQASPERVLLVNTQLPALLRYAEPPLAMITTVFSLDKRYAASAISNTLDLLASFSAPFLDKYCLLALPHDILS